MYVFILDDSPATADAAASLMQADEGEPQSRLFTPVHQGCFFGMDASDLAESFWLGHMDCGGIGQFTLDEFVDKFTSEFECQYKSRNKLAVQHLYLVGCEIGLADRWMPAAQVIADLLYRRGFAGCNVHAVINPPRADAAMLVNVLAGSQYAASLPGEVHATLYDRSTVDQLQRLQIDIDALERECRTLGVHARAAKAGMRQQLQQKCKDKETLEKEGIRFLETCDIRAELLRPHNTCIPNRPALRPEKVMAHELALVQINKLMMRLACAGAVQSTFQKQIDNVARIVMRTTSPELRLLRELRQALAAHEGPEWWRVLETYRDKFNKRTETGQAVIRLCQEARPALLISPTPVPAKKPGLFAKAKHAVTFVSTLAAAASKPVMPSDMSLAITMIKSFANQLERESHHSFFYKDLKTYKVNKLKNLASMIQQCFDENPAAPDWIPLVKDAMKDSRLVRGVISHRTYDLLDDILRRQRSYEHTPLLTIAGVGASMR